VYEYGSVGASEESMFRQLVSGDHQQLVGGDQLVGAEELVGATRVVRQQAKMRRRLVSGVPSTVVTSGSVADITIQPQELFRIERIIVPSDIAFSFIFTDIKVGQASQLVAAGQLPCGAFTEVAVDSYVSFATANVGNVVILSVQNIDSVDATFRAMLLGTAAV
jgi:hypothetical protein